MPHIDIEKGLKELREKTIVEIERATAITWGGRAAASFRLSREAATPAERVQRFHDGETYRGEAMEHAAMAEDGGALLRAIHDEVEAERGTASEALQKLLQTR